MSCHAITDASCLSFCLAAALLLQLHNAAMLPQSRLAGKQNYFATLRHSSLDMTLVILKVHLAMVFAQKEINP